MRVLLIDVNCKSSSTGQIVYNLYSYLNSHGDEAAVCYGRGEKIIERNIYKFGLDWETYLHALLTRFTGFTGCFSYFSTRRLIEYIKEYKPDVVHIHELHAYFVNIAPLLKYLSRNNVKVIHTLHCEFSYTGKCGHSVECEKWEKGCGNCPHLRDYPSTLFFDRTKRMLKRKKELFSNLNDLTIVTPSLWLAERAKKSFLGHYPINVIHNGIDTTCFRIKNTIELEKKLDIQKGEKVVLALAPNLMSHEKGGTYVVKLADGLKGKNIRFVFVGADGEKERREENKNFYGRIYDKEFLAELYSLADVFVICSERENFPTSCIEAQCCGTSIVGFDTGGTKETIVYEPEHSCVEYEDMEGLTRVLLERLENTPDKEYIATLARKEYMNQEMAQRYLELYVPGRNGNG